MPCPYCWPVVTTPLPCGGVGGGFSVRVSLLRNHLGGILPEAHFYLMGNEGGDDEGDDGGDAEGRQDVKGDLQGVGSQPEGHQVVTHAEAYGGAGKERKSFHVLHKTLIKTGLLHQNHYQ